MSSSGSGEPQVAWIALEEDALVVAADGSEVGRVMEVAGDENADIFNGIVLTHAQHGTSHYIAAERIKGIWPERVETDLTPAEAGSLPEYAEPAVTTWHADEGGGGFGARMKRAWHDLFGRHG
jgi:hypothetical protein